MFSIKGMAGYCLTLLSEATREAPTKRPADGRRRALGSRKAANSTSNGAAEGLKAGYCLMLLSEATGEAPTKRPADGQSRALGSRKAANSTSKGGITMYFHAVFEGPNVFRVNFHIFPLGDDVALEQAYWEMVMAPFS